MNEHEFWRLIKHAHRQRRKHASARDELRRTFRLTDSRETVIHLGRLLEELPFPDIVRFHRQLAATHRRAYRWELWTAFGIALPGVDHELFRACVSWLILHGRRTFTRTLANPDGLGTMTVDADDVAGADTLTTAAPEVLDPGRFFGQDEQIQRVQETLAEILGFIHYVTPPPGERIPEDLPTIRRRYPQLAARHIPAELSQAQRPFAMVPKPWCPDLDEAGAPR